jgi:hypothetical protein
VPLKPPPTMTIVRSSVANECPSSSAHEAPKARASSVSNK